MIDWPNSLFLFRISIKCNECFDNSECNYNGLCENSLCKCHPDYFGVFCQYEQPCEVISSEKDRSTTLHLLEDEEDPEGQEFVEVYGHPVYVMRNVSGKPYNLLRLGYPADDQKHFNVSYPNGVIDGSVMSHRHYHDSFFLDDDFFEKNNSSENFQELLKQYDVILRFTGQRWYGQIIPPGLTAEGFEEGEYHGTDLLFMFMQ